MLAYLVLCGRGGAPVDESLIRRFAAESLMEIPFLADERLVWRSRDGSCVVFGWEAFAEVAGIGSHWIVDERGLTAFSGHCWPAGAGWKHGTDQSWARQLRDWLEARGDGPTLREALFGHFTAISLTHDGRGWILPDFASVDQLFVAENDELVAISNRSGLCARAVSDASASPQRSLMGAGWLICDGWILDEDTGYWDVQRPRTGSSVTIEPGIGARVVEPTRPSFFAPTGDDAAASYETMLDAVENDLRGSIRAIAALPLDDRVMALSGGKDSRTVAAIIVSEGLQDRFQFVTHGSAVHADVLAARAIALRYNLDWQVTDASDRGADAEMKGVRQHAALREGLNSSWSSFEPPVFSPGATVSGVLGEALRWGPVSMSGVGAADVDELIRRVDRQRPLDRLGILKPEYRSYYQQIRHDLIRRVAASGEPMGSVSTVSYHEGLVQSRNGPDFTWSPRLRLDPFLTPICMRAGHTIPRAQRPNNRFHLDLQRRCDVGLSKLPFAASTWAEETYAHLPDAEDYRRVQPIHSTSLDGRSWRVKNYAGYRPFLDRYLLDPSNPIHTLIDSDRLTAQIHTGDANAGRTRLIWSALAAAIWIGHHEIPVTFNRSAP